MLCLPLGLSVSRILSFFDTLPVLFKFFLQLIRILGWWQASVTRTESSDF